MKKIGLSILALAITVSTFVAFPDSASAAFDPNRIIDDEAFTNAGSMPVERIQQFLSDRGSVLAGYSEGGRTAAKIIYDAGRVNNINPQVLLATLQKEQSLVTLSNYNTSTDPDGRLRKAMGYACPDSGGCDSRYAGFTNQVEGAAFQFRFNFDGSVTKRFADYQVNQTMTFDGVAVSLVNQSTAALYRYTPHISGNKSFYNTFFAYFLPYASHWAGQNGYPTLAPGDSYKFSAAFLNTGNSAWDSSIVRLGTDRVRDRIPRFQLENKTGNGDPTMWSTANRVAMQERSVPVGGVAHFDFYMAVPRNMATGTYREYFRPLAEGVQWMDDDQMYWDVTVANHQAQWAGQNFGKRFVEPGESFQLEVSLKNSGQTIWRNNGETPVRLGTSRNQDRVPGFIREDVANRNPSGWTNPNRIQMVQSTVAPGEIGTFRFWYTVPNNMASGTYREYFQPVHENVRWMNDMGIYFDIVVGAQKAAWAGQSGYVTLARNESAQFTVKFRNTGTSTWYKNGSTPMRLGTSRNQDRVPGFIREDVPGRNPSGWVNPARVAMVEDSVAPGEIGTFTFWCTVPGDKPAGTYREYFNLVQDNYSWLPDMGVFWDVTVK